MELAWRKLAAGGLAWLVGCVVAVAYLAVYFTGVVRHRCGSLLAFLLIAAALAGYLRFTPRPELWSQLFLVALLLLLVTATGDLLHGKKATPAQLWFLPVLFAAWANFHAGFTVGYVPVLLFSTWMLTSCRTLPLRGRMVALIPCALALVTWTANPYGWHFIALGAKIGAMPYVTTHIMEWMPLFARTEPPWPLPAYVGAVALSGIAVFACAATWRTARLPWWQAATIAFLAALALAQRRHVGLAAIGFVALMVPAIARLEQLLPRHMRTGIAVATALLVVAIGAMQHAGKLDVGRRLFVTGVYANVLPAFATDFLRANPPPPGMFNTYGIGGYLLYSLGPQTQVFIDGRLDVYDKQTWLDYMAIEDGRMTIREAEEKYRLNTFVVSTRGSDDAPLHLANRLAQLQDWKLVFFDDQYAVFVRDCTDSREYVRRHQLEHVSPFSPSRLSIALKNPALRAAAEAELVRSRRMSGSNATAIALGGLAARETGDEATARRLLADAIARNPNCGLARRLAAAPTAPAEP
jgi:hypothetical protein